MASMAPNEAASSSALPRLIWATWCGARCARSVSARQQRRDGDLMRAPGLDVDSQSTPARPSELQSPSDPRPRARLAEPGPAPAIRLGSEPRPIHLGADTGSLAHGLTVLRSQRSADGGGRWSARCGLHPFCPESFGMGRQGNRGGLGLSESRCFVGCPDRRPVSGERNLAILTDLP